jgi:hypothetical protein
MPSLKDAVSGEVALPRDNPIKDFLRSEDSKRRLPAADAASQSGAGHRWDDYIDEPISALLSPGPGLLTPNSFEKLPDGSRRAYPDVDAVVLLRHQHQFVQGSANRAPCDDRDSFLHYGRPGVIPSTRSSHVPMCNHWTRSW